MNKNNLQKCTSAYIGVLMILCLSGCLRSKEPNTSRSISPASTSKETAISPFSQYIGHYPEWSGNGITDSTFTGNGTTDIPDELLAQVLPLNEDEQTSREFFHFNHGHKVTAKQYIALFFTKVYDISSGLLEDKMLYTFTPQGKLIDSLTIGRTTHFYEASDDAVAICEIAPAETSRSFIALQHKEHSVILDRGEIVWNTLPTRITIQEDGQLSTSPQDSLQSLTYENIFKLTPNTPEAFVQHLYQQIAAARTRQEPDISTDYLTSELLQLRAACLQKAKQENDIPIFDYDLWTDAQDWCSDLSVISINKEEENNEHTQVTVTISNCGKETDIHLILKQVKKHWHVDDFITTSNGEELSAKESMRAYLSSQTDIKASAVNTP